MWLVGVSLCLFQHQIDPVRTGKAIEMSLEAQSRAITRDYEARLARERLEFEERFNRLIAAAAAFTEQYNRGKGQLWPQKEADALRKAMTKLQESRTWKLSVSPEK